jgi:hypothetical protein
VGLLTGKEAVFILCIQIRYPILGLSAGLMVGSRCGSLGMKEARAMRVVTVRLFGFLRSLMRERGLPDYYEREIPGEGSTGSEIAAELRLPEERIEAVFRNGNVQRLDARIFPGDRVAFVPYGTPGPYRVLLGMVRKNPQRSSR